MISQKQHLIIYTGTLYFNIKCNYIILNRAGRAGRAGRKGFVSNLYHNKDNQVISELKSSNETGEPLQIKASAFSYNINLNFHNFNIVFIIASKIKKL